MPRSGRVVGTDTCLMGTEQHMATKAALGLLRVSRARRHSKVGALLSLPRSPFCQAWGESSVISAWMQGE